MSETCDTCGLPDELCVCDDVERTETVLTVTVEERKYNDVTLVEGVESNKEDLASELKSTLACGGTVKDGKIELQGDHTGRVEDELEDRGYEVE